MPELRTIEIDFDVHKLIEAERRSFGELPNDALRRLLSLPERPREPASVGTAVATGGGPWSSDGVVLPHGTQLRMTYNKRTHSGEISDGKWIVEGRTYDSPSGAASDVGRTKNDRKTRLDGWNYWQVLTPGETEWKSIASMRPDANMTADELLRTLKLQ